MLLNNFRRVLVNTISRELVLSTNSTNGMTREMKTTMGLVYRPTRPDYPPIAGLYSDYCNICTSGEDYYSTEITTSLVSFYEYEIYLGTGNVTPTIDDYKLSGELVTGLTSQVQNTSATNNSFTFSAIAINNTESPVTIKEIGLGGNTNGATGVFLLTRDVLATPVTINVGDSKTFSITIDLRSLTDTTVNE